ncbi:hypothetical protein GGI25_004053 [Coemansia spiralis]|uniref:Uncharacterized protein n=2 Tax=Coemansia TaxID=4863 RepID=A0A9W8KXH9_9FUNG|nr:hypothetical protein BX070DRAFT_55142 [Coemansia spiralis]KAJ1991681.1 hypothetical protein EDC05_003306 [Coemansia umbellata]KAJ2620861.1 hypothetical protein GGI26_004656 [Coemansia sp. RSA 1358]KAJ2675213.1 hypothetical protein GGI25_004053 [Coemansia spiralis]
MNTEILARVGSPDVALSNEECQRYYNENASYLEIREFVIKYALTNGSTPPPESPYTGDSAKPKRTEKAKQNIPIASLRAMLNSLLEGERYEEGIRFLTAIGEGNIIQDKTVVSNLLAVFKPTHVIEKERKERSSFLLQSMKKSNISSASVWKIDDNRRRTIARSQQNILTYLTSVSKTHQFVRTWYNETYADDSSAFDEYFTELVSPPEPEYDYSYIDAEVLEQEMYVYRITLACTLLEQMRADLISNIDSPTDSVFYMLVYGKYGRSSLSNWIERLGDTITIALDKHFDRACAQKARILASHIANMLFVLTTCGAIDFDRVAASVVALPDFDYCECIELLDLVELDTAVVKLIDYFLVSYCRFDLKADKRVSELGSKFVLMPPGSAKTIICLQSARPKLYTRNPKNWYIVISFLMRLVQRSVNVYVSRMYQINSNQQLALSDASDCSRVLLVNRTHSSGSMDTAALYTAYTLLLEHVKTKLQHHNPVDRQNTASDDSSASDQDNDNKTCDKGNVNELGYTRHEMIVTVYQELDLLELLICKLVKP